MYANPAKADLVTSEGAGQVASKILTSFEELEEDERLVANS